MMGLVLALLLPATALGFSSHLHSRQGVSLKTQASGTSSSEPSRRDVFNLAGLAMTAGLFAPEAAQATVFFDPAMYGDQENRQAAVATCQSAVRLVWSQAIELIGHSSSNTAPGDLDLG